MKFEISSKVIRSLLRNITDIIFYVTDCGEILVCLKLWQSYYKTEMAPTAVVVASDGFGHRPISK